VVRRLSVPASGPSVCVVIGEVLVSGYIVVVASVISGNIGTRVVCRFVDINLVVDLIKGVVLDFTVVLLLLTVFDLNELVFEDVLVVVFEAPSVDDFSDLVGGST